LANRRIDQLLARRKRSGFARLLDHASNRDAWTATLRAFLPKELGTQCQVANVRDHVLTVHLSNAAWATRFRFLIPELKPRLNLLADFATVQEIRIKVAPFLPLSAMADRLRDRSPPDATLLSKFADDLDYGELKEAILRLARHGVARRAAHETPSFLAGSESSD
jgi:hypothetical protein